MRVLPLFLFVAAFPCAATFHHLAAQTSSAPSTPPTASPAAAQPASPASTLSTGTQLVVVDVTVQSRDGKSVHGLKASDFMLDEKKKPQVIKTFEEHTASANPSVVPLPKLPPGTFTDYTPFAPDTTLNVLLLDTLNTPMKDQAYVRYQLQQYVKKASPGTRIAIFGLTSRLILLQGFTTDPDVLKGAVEHRLIPRASVLLDDPSGSNTDPMLVSDAMSQAGASASAVAATQQFEAQNATFQTQLRTQYTLDAFSAIGRYLSAYPGRKNLIWFSGAFPLTIFPDPNLDDPFAAQADFSDQLRVTSGLLARARVAVYPIDARGLQTNPVMDASRSGAGYARNPQKFGADTSKFLEQNAQEHMAMEQVAEDTGGHAFYNTNGLAEAVAKALDSGGNYYTLTYSPGNRDWNGDYRRIDVKLQGAAAAQGGLKLSYRHGYYADDPNSRKIASSVLTAAPANAPVTGTANYARLSMDRGAPAPSEVLFKLRVLPTSATPEDAVAPHNQPNPTVKGPFRRYQVDFVALANDMGITKQTDGKYHGEVEFVAFVYSADGKLLNVEGDTVGMSLPPDVYANVLKTGLRFALQVSAPAKSESFLRLAVHDVPTGKLGILEVPTTAISTLPPLPANEQISPTANIPKSDTPKPPPAATTPPQ